MRLFILYLFFSIVCSQLSQAQHKANNIINIYGKWEMNEKAAYLFERIQTKINGDNVLTSSSYSAKVEISIIEVKEDGYIFQWQYTDIKFQDSEFNIASLELSKFWKDRSVIYVTNKNGSFKGLLNWKEIQLAANEHIISLEKVYTAQDYILPINQLKTLFNSKESIEQLALQEIQLFHVMHGITLTLKQKIVEESTLPNFLGGEPFSSLTTIVLTDLNVEENSCSITSTQVPDQDKITEMANDYIEKNSGGKFSDSPRIAVRMEELSEFCIEITSGWLKLMQRSRTIAVGKTNAVDTYKLKKL